ncbi:MAG: FUSC family protein [Bacteroidota bacterium]
MSLELRGIRSYKKLTRLIQNESFEPLISWGIRMALSGTLPLIWGIATGHVTDAIWIALTAEAVSWVELKGAFAWRVRTLIFGALLSILFAVIGTVIGNSIVLSVMGMFFVGFLATMLKNIGDRASGLAICVYLLFIICNAWPVNTAVELQQRLILIGIGAAWPVVVGITISLATPAEEPFRRQIALIWRAIASLVEAIANTGNDKIKNAEGEVYVKEKNVRTAMDSSYQFYDRMAHQVNKEDNNQQYQLSMLRKLAGLVAVNVTTMGLEMEHIAIRELDNSLRLKAAALFNAMHEAVNRISVFIINLKPEEKIIAQSHINRMKKLSALIKQYPAAGDEKSVRSINRILLLTERNVKLLESAIARMEQMGEDVPVFRSYSLIKTLFILKPKYLLSNLRDVFNFDTFNTRYALRSAIAATIGLFIYKLFHIDHGYWIAFSVMIVIQPYFGATLKRAVERVVGTLLGGIAGGLLLRLPTGMYITEAIMFATFILMVYYVRKNYSVAVFVVTLNLVLLFNIEETYNTNLMVTRALCTVGGAILAIGSGFALLPTWDRKWLPAHLAAAIKCNYEYYIKTFYAPERITTWTKYKRGVESKNSNVFDSFNRYLSEPGSGKSTAYYDIITHNVRITRNLNNIHLEQDEKRAASPAPADERQQRKVNEGLSIFNEIMALLQQLDKNEQAGILADAPPTPFALNDAQVVAVEKVIIELKTIRDDLRAQLAGLPA